jgi:MFS transporter, FHS family, L-fucose permease
MPQHQLEPPSRYRLAVAATVMLFVIWGLAEPVYSRLSPQFADFFALDPSATALTLSLVGTAYFLFAIPSALLLRKVGYKLAVLIGLGGFSGGALLIYPAIVQHQYLFFVAAAVTVGAGYSMLETSANPLIAQMGSPRHALFRLNFAQAFYPIGLLAGVFVTDMLLASNQRLASPEQMEEAVRPYLIIGLGLVLLAFLVETLEFPHRATASNLHGGGARSEFKALLSRPVFRAALAAEAAYVAAQTCAWGLIPHYLGDSAQTAGFSAADVLLWSWIAYAVGRFAGTALIAVFKPSHMLALASFAALVMTAIAAGAGGTLGVFCLVGANLFMSIMFPTIFGNAIRGLGPLTKSASGLIVTASGFGVTAATVAMDGFAKTPSMYLLAGVSVCFAVVASFALADRKASEPDAMQAQTPVEA